MKVISKTMIVILFLAVAETALAGNIDFTDQYHSWRTTGPDSALVICSISEDLPDTTLGQQPSDYFVYAEDTVGFVEQAIIVDFVWDSIFGFGPEKIPNPSQVDSCIIDSADLVYYVVGTGTDADSIVFWRLHTDVTNDGSYATWNNPESGQGWNGDGAFSLVGDVVHGDDSVLYNNKTFTAWDTTRVSDIWQAFADSMTRRTGMAITIPTDQSQNFQMLHKSAGGFTELRIWWSEYGVKSTDAYTDSTADIQNRSINKRYSMRHYSHSDIYNPIGHKPALMFYDTCYNLTTVRYLKDSLDLENVHIDSMGYNCYVHSYNPDVLERLVFSSFQVYEWWKAGPNGSQQCAVDYYHQQHETDPEFCPEFSWTNEGCGSPTSRNATPFAVDTITGTGWLEITISQTEAQYIWDFDEAGANRHGGVFVFSNDEVDGAYIEVRTPAYPGDSTDPYWIVYYQIEVEPGGRTRPASIDEVVNQGAYIR